MTNDDSDSTETSSGVFITAMAEGAAGLHELYTAFLAAGFTQSEALTLVSAILVDGFRKPMETDDSA
jgi:hypothetical protein